MFRTWVAPARRPGVPFDRAMKTNAEFKSKVEFALRTYRRSLRGYDQDTMAPGKHRKDCVAKFRETLVTLYKAHNIDRSTFETDAEALMKTVRL